MMSLFFKSMTIGLARRWRTGLTQALGVVGAIWLATEIATRVSEEASNWLDANGNTYTAVLLVAGTLWFLAYSYERRTIRFRVPTTDSHITVQFGDIFEAEANWLIGVNEFFDSKLGQIVAQTSVHGQFIAKAFNGDEGRFRVAVDAALAGKRCTPTARANLPKDRYEIGTTAIVTNGPRRAFLVAMSHTDLATAKASSTVPLLWDAMKGALQAVHDYGNGEPLAMPLIGNGLSSVNIEPQHLLRLLVLALVDFGRKTGLPKNVTVVVPEACFEQLDIREIGRDWTKH